MEFSNQIPGYDITVKHSMNTINILMVDTTTLKEYETELDISFIAPYGYLKNLRMLYTLLYNAFSGSYMVGTSLDDNVLIVLIARMNMETNIYIRLEEKIDPVKAGRGFKTTYDHYEISVQSAQHQYDIDIWDTTIPEKYHILGSAVVSLNENIDTLENLYNILYDAFVSKELPVSISDGNKTIDIEVSSRYMNRIISIDLSRFRIKDKDAQIEALQRELKSKDEIIEELQRTYSSNKLVFSRIQWNKHMVKYTVNILHIDHVVIFNIDTEQWEGLEALEYLDETHFELVELPYFPIPELMEKIEYVKVLKTSHIPDLTNIEVKYIHLSGTYFQQEEVDALAEHSVVFANKMYSEHSSKIKFNGQILNQNVECFIEGGRLWGKDGHLIKFGNLDIVSIPYEMNNNCSRRLLCDNCKEIKGMGGCKIVQVFLQPPLDVIKKYSLKRAIYAHRVYR